MSGMAPRPAAGSSTTTKCTLLSSQESMFATTPKNKLNQQARVSGPTGAAPIAFATDAQDEFAEFAWLDDEGADSAGEEAAQALDDLQALESVFGNTEVDSSATSSSSDVGSSSGVDDGLREEKAVCCVEDALEGEDAEGLLRLFDDDLQDALLALADGDLDSCSEKGKGAHRLGPRAFSTTVDCGGYDTTSDNTSVDCCGSDAAIDCGASDTSSAAGPSPTVALLPPSDCGAQGTPAALELPAGSKRVDTDGTGLFDTDGTGLVETAGQSDSGSGDGLGENAEDDGGRASPKTPVLPTDRVAAPASPAAATTAAATPAATTAAAATAAAAAAVSPVPSRLLDAIDLWESANAHSKMRKKAAERAAREREAAAAQAGAARGTGGRRGGAVTTRSKAKKVGKAATNGGGGGSSNGTDVTKKKKNEFGKRRRSSGGGGATAPVLAAAAAAAPVKAKGKGKGKKKVDPLVAVRDARSMSKKPLIVQWLKSDGCDSDAEAEAALGRAVGSLSAISRYWGGGG